MQRPGIVLLCRGAAFSSLFVELEISAEISRGKTSLHGYLVPFYETKREQEKLLADTIAAFKNAVDGVGLCADFLEEVPLSSPRRAVDRAKIFNFWY